MPVDEQQHTATHGISSQASLSLSSITQRTSAAKSNQRGLGFDLNLPPPIEEASQQVRSDIGGSISHGLRGWKRKKDRTQREIVLGPSLQTGSPSQSGTRAIEEDSPTSHGNPKRMRRLDSLMERERHPKSADGQSNEGATRPEAQRVLPSRQAKGKAVSLVAAPQGVWGGSSSSSLHNSPTSSSSASGYDSGDSQSESSHDLGPPATPRPVKQNVRGKRHNKGTPVRFEIGPTSSKTALTRKWKNYIPGSRTHQRQIAKKAFYEVWDKHGINSDMPPSIAAARVMQMKIPQGLSHDTFGRYASDEITRDIGKGYHTQYTTHLRNLKTSYFRYRRAAEETGELAGMSPEMKRKHLVRKAIKNHFEEPRLPYVHKRPGRVAHYNRRVDEAEQAARKHLASKQIDFDKASLNTVEKELRDVDHTNYGITHGKTAFVNDVHRMLRRKKGANDEDIKRFIKGRKAEKNPLFNGLLLH